MICNKKELCIFLKNLDNLFRPINVIRESIKSVGIYKRF